MIVDLVIDTKTKHIVDNDVIDLERPMWRKLEKAKQKARTRPTEDIVEIFRMKYTLLKKSHTQEKELFYLKEEKMQYDREMEGHKIWQEDERLKLEVKRLDIV